MDALADTVVAITGASSGIGAATARRLAGRGAAVVLGARRTDRLETLAADIRSAGGRASTATVDVTRAEDLRRLVATAVSTYGRLDVLVSNAGIGPISPMTARRTADWNAMIDVNLRGVLHGIDAALPAFEEQGRGHFVTIVSTAGIKILPTMAVYAATKNAVRTLLEGLRQESTDGTLKTTAISPGYVRTEFGDSITDPAVLAGIDRRTEQFALDPVPWRGPSSSRSTNPGRWRSASCRSDRRSRASRTTRNTTRSNMAGYRSTTPCSSDESRCTRSALACRLE